MRTLTYTHKHECHWDGSLTFTGDPHVITFTFGKHYSEDWNTKDYLKKKPEILFWLENSTTPYYAEKFLKKVEPKILSL